MKQKLTIIVLFLFLPFFAIGQWIQIGDNINGDAADDGFGRGISISNDGKILAIGAFFNDGNGVDSGQVRIYENIEGVWTQIGDDIYGEAAGDESGFSIDLNNEGNIIAIGARSNRGNGVNSGHVRVFENIDGLWNQVGADIDGEAAYNLSGQAVAISGNGTIVAIGANSNGGNGANSGHVRIYEYMGGVWTQLGDDIDGEAAGDLSGWSVDLNNDGNIVAIGAVYNSGANAELSGHVRIYENIGGVWTQLGDDIDGDRKFDFFGNSVSLNYDGNVVAIGAVGAHGVNGRDSGQVRVFENGGGAWNQIGADIDGEATGDYFGESVDLNNDGNIVAIGGFAHDGANGAESGQVRIYQNTEGVWTQIGDAIDGDAAGDFFGINLSLSGNGSVVAIGASANDTNGIDAGQVKVYGNALLSIENNIFEEKISLYPNPTYGVSLIKFKSTYSRVELLVYDAIGKIIKQETYNNTNSLEINSQNYAAGIYLLRIIFDEKYAELKLIKR